MLELTNEFAGSAYTPSTFKILVVDDDEACLANYAELIESLGYTCVAVPDAFRGLQAMARDPYIGLVISDLRMPRMDGFTFLEELSQRYAGIRPLVTLVIAGDVSAEIALKVLRADAIDFLEKPVTILSLAAALRRGKARWDQLTRQSFTSLPPPPVVAPPPPEPELPAVDAEPSPAELKACAELIQKTRQIRSKFFDPQIIAGPAWDILVDLTVAGLEDRQVPTSSACAATEAPFTTALRYVNQLVEAGLVTKVADEGDRRRTLLQLEPGTFNLMKRYLGATMESGLPLKPIEPGWRRTNFEAARASL